MLNNNAKGSGPLSVVIFVIVLILGLLFFGAVCLAPTIFPNASDTLPILAMAWGIGRKPMKMSDLVIAGIVTVIILILGFWPF